MIDFIYKLLLLLLDFIVYIFFLFYDENKKGNPYKELYLKFNRSKIKLLKNKNEKTRFRFISKLNIENYFK